MRRAWDQLLPKISSPVRLVLPLLSFLVWVGNRHSLVLQGVVLTLAVGSIVLGLTALHTPWNDVKKKYSVLMVGAGLLIIVGLCWNTLFLVYIKTTGYEGDIFRKTMHNFHSPIYGQSALSRWPWSLILILFSGTFVVRVVCWRDTWIEHRGLGIELVVWFAGFIFMFALSDGPERLIGTFAHYRTFASDISTFEGFGHALRTYSQQMPQLSVHNAHYPPGNLLLVMAASRLGVSWFARGVVICFTLLTLLPIVGITSELHLFTYTKNIVIALFISSFAVLSLPSAAMTPIPMFLAATAMWLVLVAIRRESILYSGALGVVMTVFSFLSFTSIIGGVLLISIAMTQILFNRVRPSIPLKLGFVAIAVYLLLCWLFYLFTGFNLFLCFLKATEHNFSIMASGYDSTLRYLFRSTGNLIAWMCSIGFAASIFGILAGVNALRRPIEGNRTASAYSAAVMVTVLLTAFSTLFFLETERIWLLFVPPWAVVAATGIGQVTATYKGFLLKSLLIFSVLLSTGQELIFTPFYG